MNMILATTFRNVRSSALAFVFVSLATLFVLVGPAVVRAQYNDCYCGDYGTKSAVTNTGQEFMLCFDANDTSDYTTASYQSIYLAAVTNATTTVSITCKADPSFSKTIILAPFGFQSYKVSNDIYPLIDSHEQVDNTVVHVVADNPIICYGMNHKNATSDAFLALPANVAQNEYRVMSYYNSTADGSSTFTGYDYQSEFSVAAFKDNTQVTITTTAETMSGIPAGVPTTYTLNAGQCVQVQANEFTDYLDLTGSEVIATNPVTVYGAHDRAEVPVGFHVGVNAPSRNTLTEALPPTTAWGQSFVCVGFQGRGRTLGDVMRVLAENDNTVITINGAARITLKANQFYDTLIGNINPTSVQSSQPILVAMLSHTAEQALDGVGDPFMAIVPPLDQTYNSFTFFSSDDSTAFGDGNFVIVVTEQTGVGKITLDGLLVPTASFETVPFSINGSNWAIATLALTSSGAHSISTTNGAAQGITILGYGLGYVDGYGYTAGALLKPQQAVFVKNGDSPALAKGAVPQQNTVLVRNIMARRAYLDSARIVFDDEQGNAYTATFQEDVADDIKHLEEGEDVLLHVNVDPPLATPVTATAEVFSHTAQWFDLKPGMGRIKLVPVPATASVASSTTDHFFSSAFPNPASDHSTISFSLPTSADISLKIYDDLGRLVKTLVDHQMPMGPYDIRWESGRVANGHYTYELKSERLNINERHSIVVSR